MLRAFGVTDKGPVRASNQDCFLIDEELGLCVVADGMGGHNAGEVASRMVVDAVVDHVRRAAATFHIGGGFRAALHPFGFDPSLSETGNTLRTAILLGNVQVLEKAATAPRYAGMGTTVVVVQVVDGRAVIAHVGDSRLYLLHDDALEQLTTDDSWMATMMAQNPGSPQRFRDHPMRHALTNVVGGRAQTEVHIAEPALSHGDMLLLTTDGVHGVVEGPRLAELMAEGTDPRSIARLIVEEALERGTQDNVTAVVGRYED